MLFDGKASARRAWGASPTGWTAAGGAQPGTRDFFERAMKFRSEIEQPWLPDVVPFRIWRGKRVLELGHGPGYDAYTIMKAGAQYTGIDITPENVDRTQKHLAYYGLTPNVSQGDAEQLTFADNTFDVVYSNGVLHHTPDINQAFREAKRVLMPNGIFYVIVYHRHSIFYWITLGLWCQLIRGGWRQQSLHDRLRAIESNTIGERPIVNVYSSRELRKLLEEAGFTVESIVVRKLSPADLPAEWLFKYVPPVIYDVVARAWGWYLIAEGRA